MTPGSWAVKATKPPPDDAEYSVRKSPPPPMTRLRPLMKPPRPPEPKRVEVSMPSPGVSHPTSPLSAMMRSPGARVTSRTGIVVPTVRVCMAPKLAGERHAAVEIVGTGEVGQREEHRADAQVAQPRVALGVRRRLTRAVPSRIRRRRHASAQPLDPAGGVLPGRADHRDVEHGDDDVVGVAAGPLGRLPHLGD